MYDTVKRMTLSMRFSLASLMILTVSAACSNVGTGSPVERRNTIVGNPMVEVSIAADAAVALRRSPLQSLLLPAAFAAGSDVQLMMCFDRIRFKYDDDTGPADGDIEFPIGRVVDNGQGSTLGSVQVPAGTYKRIEFDFKPNCGDSTSVIVSNLFGLFSTNERIRVRFEGDITISENTKIKIGTRPLRDALTSIQSGPEIPIALESIAGTFDLGN